MRRRIRGAVRLEGAIGSRRRMPAPENGAANAGSPRPGGVLAGGLLNL
jgi:hypothetical protein